MSAVLYGVAGLKWGTVDQTGFIIENIEETSNIEETTMEDGDGDIVGVVYHKAVGEISCDFTVKGSGAPALTLPGSTFTITGDSEFAGTYHVKSVSRTRAKGAYMTGKLTATRFRPTDLSTTTTTTS